MQKTFDIQEIKIKEFIRNTEFDYFEQSTETKKYTNSFRSFKKLLRMNEKKLNYSKEA